MSRRVERVGETIRQEVSKAILYKLQDPRISLVAVTNVKLSPDLRLAKIYVTVHGDESTQNETLEVLKRATSHIQFEMATNLKLRNTPSLSFYLDDKEKQSNHILKLINKAVNEDHYNNETTPPSAPL